MPPALWMSSGGFIAQWGCVELCQHRKSPPDFPEADRHSSRTPSNLASCCVCQVGADLLRMTTLPFHWKDTRVQREMFLLKEVTGLGSSNYLGLPKMSSVSSLNCANVAKWSDLTFHLLQRVAEWKKDKRGFRFPWQQFPNKPVFCCAHCLAGGAFCLKDGRVNLLCGKRCALPATVL